MLRMEQTYDILPILSVPLHSEQQLPPPYLSCEYDYPSKLPPPIPLAEPQPTAKVLIPGR